MNHSVFLQSVADKVREILGDQHDAEIIPADRRFDLITGHNEAVVCAIEFLGVADVNCIAWDATGGIAEERYLCTIPTDDMGIEIAAFAMVQIYRQRQSDQSVPTEEGDA